MNWARPTAEGVLLSLRVTPNAGRDVIETVETRADGAVRLRLRVKSVPEKGRANAAVIALLAKTLGVPKSQFTLTAGETSRDKTVLWRGGTIEALSRLAA